MRHQNYFVYILTNADRHTVLYIGVTNGLERRASEHSLGFGSAFARQYNAHKLIYFEAYPDPRSAIAREKQLKRWSRAKKEALIARRNPAWDDLFSKMYALRPVEVSSVMQRAPSTSLGMTRHRVLAIFFCLTLGIASLAFAQPDADFAKANQDFAQRHFKEAISDYEALIHDGQWSANVFYDLGNAYFRAGDFGRAILNYERALALERHHPEAMANLQIARDEAGAVELQPSWPERYLQFASVNQYSIAAAVAFWVAAFCLAALIFAPRRSAARISLLVVMFLVFAGSIFAIWQLERGSKSDALAIVTGKNVQARLATADTANAVLALPPGSEIKILSTRGDWIYAALPTNLRGWIPAKDAEQVRL